MQGRHVPRIDLRYWAAIICASIFGTNLGDLYAHDSGLGTGLGVLLLAALFAVAWLVEPRDRTRHEAWYWLAIIIIRTGATNIADYLAYRVRIPGPLLVVGLAALVAALAPRGAPPGADRAAGPGLPRVGLPYWAAMLAAGVLGTVAGDLASHLVGQGVASIALGLPFVVLVLLAGNRLGTRAAAYWCAVALARTAGTCIGDWLAENRLLHLGLPLSTLLTGVLFVGLLVLWRSPQRVEPAAA